MSKLRIKVSGCMRSMTGAGAFCAIRSYLATATRHGISWLDALPGRSRNSLDAGHHISQPGRRARDQPGQSPGRSSRSGRPPALAHDSTPGVLGYIPPDLDALWQQAQEDVPAAGPGKIACTARVPAGLVSERLR